MTIRTLHRIVLSISAMAVAACSNDQSRQLTPSQEKAIADTIRSLVVNTYDLSRPNAVERLMSLYPESGPVYSSASGQVSSTRAQLQQQIQTFWQYVGSNMRNPKWEWRSMQIDVLSPDAAVMTASYRVPHLNRMNTPHVIAGAWTAVFVKRGARWVVIQEHLSDVPPASDSTRAAEHAGH